jgi:hypothetical protein
MASRNGRRRRHRGAAGWRAAAPAGMIESFILGAAYGICAFLLGFLRGRLYERKRLANQSFERPESPRSPTNAPTAGCGVGESGIARLYQGWGAETPRAATADGSPRTIRLASGESRMTASAFFACRNVTLARARGLDW